MNVTFFISFAYGFTMCIVLYYMYAFLVFERVELKSTLRSLIGYSLILSFLMGLLIACLREGYFSNYMPEIILLLFLSWWARKKRKSYLLVGMSGLISFNLIIAWDEFLAGITLINNEYFNIEADIWFFSLLLFLELLLVYMLIFWIKKFFLKADYSRQIYILILCVAINIAFILLAIIFYGLNGYVPDFLEAFSIICLGQMMMAIVLLFFVVMNHQIRKHYQFKPQEDYLNNMIVYTEKLEAAQLNLAKFKHDHRNMLSSFKLLADNADIDGIQQHLKEWIAYSDQQFNNNVSHYQTLSQVRNKYVKSLLLTKIYDMERLDIPFYFQCSQPMEETGLANFDFIRILGIFLDNAIEANRGLPYENRGINVLLETKGNQVEIAIENSFLGEVDLSKFQEKGVSSKLNHQGLGLSIVKDLMASNPNLFIAYEVDSGKFLVTMTIMKEEGPYA